MPLMVGNIVVLNSGSPRMTVKAITHSGQVLLPVDRLPVASCTKWNLRPRCCRKSTKPRGQTNGEYPRSPTEAAARSSGCAESRRGAYLHA